MMITKSPDFIIPFLVNQSTEGVTRTDSITKKKRYSIPNRSKEFNPNSSMELVKIYKAGKKRWDRQEKSPQQQPEKRPKIETTQRKTQEMRQKGHSQLQLSLQKSPYVSKNRFFKAKSLINHLPVHSQEPLPIKYSPQKVQKNSPIPGIRFKKKTMLNESANLIAPNHPPDEEYKSQFAGKIRNWREKKEWNRKRSANVDFIINRKCKNFNDLIGEYRKRLGLLQTAKIFIFNSQDSWLKRVLAQRGWIQNPNKQSRAFHLYWSSKIYKEGVFPEQMINHYRNSDLLTSKAGLHRMLVKYRLTQLQPMTFDLTFQKDEFVLYFIKISFLGRLNKLIAKFIFQEDPICKTFQELRNQFIVLRGRFKNEGAIEDDLINLIENCFMLLQGNLKQLTTYYLDQVFFQTHSLLKLTPNEEDLVRILRDFEFLCRINKVFYRETASGLQNVWLTKSKTSSKGVGISLHKDLDSILKHQNRLAQKYVQNPLIFTAPSIKGRKFDIRVWVLLVGNLKAKLFYHQKFYGRLCFEPYSLETITLDNQKKHLTNYSQNKLSFHDHNLDNSIILPTQIFQLISKEKGVNFRNIFYEVVEGMLSKMAVIFRNEVAAGNSNSFELFGLDLLIDNNLNLHLLEVNLSAACEERHPGLSSMMEDVTHGMLNILEGDSDLRGWRPIK